MNHTPQNMQAHPTNLCVFSPALRGNLTNRKHNHLLVSHDPCVAWCFCFTKRVCVRLPGSSGCVIYILRRSGVDQEWVSAQEWVSEIFDNMHIFGFANNSHPWSSLRPLHRTRRQQTSTISATIAEASRLPLTSPTLLIFVRIPKTQISTVTGFRSTSFSEN